MRTPEQPSHSSLPARPRFSVTFPLSCCSLCCWEMHRWSIRPSWTTSPAQPQAGKTNYCDREEPPSPHQGAVSALRSGPTRQAWQRARLAFSFYSPLRCPPPQMKEVSKSTPALTRLGESLLTCETHTWTAVDKECVSACLLYIRFTYCWHTRTQSRWLK